jgi:predicted nucleotidyltransferase
MARPRDVDEVEGALRGMPPELKARWPVSHAGVFGSWARREQREGSDLDLPVDLDRPVGFEIVALEDEIERRLGLPVDLVMRGSLRRRIGRRILDEVQAVGGTALPAVRDSWHGGRLINQAT